MWCILGELGSIDDDAMTSAAKETPTTSGGSSEDWEINEGRNDRREAQVWQVDVTQEIALFMSKAKNCH